MIKKIMVLLVLILMSCTTYKEEYNKQYFEIEEIQGIDPEFRSVIISEDKLYLLTSCNTIKGQYILTNDECFKPMNKKAFNIISWCIVVFVLLIGGVIGYAICSSVRDNE